MSVGMEERRWGGVGEKREFRRKGTCLRWNG